MKYLVVAALAILLFLLVYSRVRPYLKFVKKILGTLNAMADPSAQGGAAKPSAARVESKLVRCVSCGTWVPEDRALGSRLGASTYCSRACLEKPSNSKERKIAG